MIGGDAGQYRLSQLINKLEDKNHKLEQKVDNLEKMIMKLLEKVSEHIYDDKSHIRYK